MNLKKCLQFYLIVLAGLALPVHLFAQSGKTTLYFYSSESNINNFGSLKTEYDTYLANLGNYQLQPFSERKIFEEMTGQKIDGLLIVSSWHYQLLRNKGDTEPVLIGVNKGQSTQKRILSAKNDIKQIESLRGQTIASASSEEYTRTLLLEMLGEGEKELITSIRILSVPKEIDALMAVGFGMAKAALSTETSLEKLAQMNLKQRQMLIPLAESKKTLLPIIAVPTRSKEALQPLLAALQKMGDDEAGLKLLKMIGLTGWKTLSPAERSLIE